jgi:hypothetical protein
VFDSPPYDLLSEGKASDDLDRKSKGSGNRKTSFVMMLKLAEAASKR